MKIYQSKSIPKHPCCPLCDGQKYCIEPGTHTLEIATPEEIGEMTTRLVFANYGYDVFRIKEESDVSQLYYKRFLDGWVSKRAVIDTIMTEEEAAKQTKGWLVTLKEKEENDTKETSLLR